MMMRADVDRDVRVSGIDLDDCADEIPDSPLSPSIRHLSIKKKQLVAQALPR